MAPDNTLHLDLGTTEEYYGIPYTVVPASQPLVPIRFGTDGVDYSDESDPGPMPIPLDAPIEGGSTAEPDPGSGDRHLLVVRQGDCMLYELYNTVRDGDGFRVSSSAVWPLGVNSSRPAGWTSADAAGLPRSWPLSPINSPETALLLDPESGGEAGWWVLPEDTAAAPAGTYSVSAVLDTTSSSSGWNIPE